MHWPEGQFYTPSMKCTESEIIQVPKRESVAHIAIRVKLSSLDSIVLRAVRVTVITVQFLLVRSISQYNKAHVIKATKL